jgi:hypothetical protein
LMLMAKHYMGKAVAAAARPEQPRAEGAAASNGKAAEG